MRHFKSVAACAVTLTTFALAAIVGPTQDHPLWARQMHMTG